MTAALPAAAIGVLGAVLGGVPVLAPATIPLPPPVAAQEAQAAALPALPATAPLPRSRPLWLQVPGIGRVEGIEELGLQADGTLEVRAGARTVGWYAGGSSPGERGPAVLVGHVTWSGRPAVFYPLGRLRPGQLVTVGRADSRVLSFRVRTVESFAKNRFPTERVYGPTRGPQLRLVTCGGRWNGRTHADNVVVFADLVGDATHEPTRGGEFG